MSRGTAINLGMLAVTAMLIDSKSKKKNRQKNKEEDIYGNVIEVEVIQEHTYKTPLQTRAIASAPSPLPKLALESVLNYLESTGSLTSEHRNRIQSDIERLKIGYHTPKERRLANA